MISLEGIAAALLPPEHGGPEPSALAARVRGVLDGLPGHARRSVRAVGAAVEAAALARHGRGLRALPAHERAAVLERFAARAPEAEQALAVVKALVLLVDGGDRFDAELAGRAQQQPPARDDPPLRLTPAAHWPGQTRWDAVVVGSGAGGAMAARTLARAGLRVAVVEEGRRFGVTEFREGRAVERFTALYRDGGATATLGRPPIMLPLGRGVGGTTLVNSGTCYRTPETVLRRWRDEHGLGLADPAAFAPLLDEVEQTLQVAPVPEAVLGRNGALALAGAAALGWRAGPLLRNAPGCDGCCQCAIGCPRNAKFGVHLNALPQACAAGAEILSEARVARVLHEHGRAVGVLARRADGTPLRLLADRVVLAAGATETPALLWRSGLGRHPRTGRNLAIHPAIGIAGRFDEAVTAWHGVLQSAAVEEFHEREGILIEATSGPPGMGTISAPGYGPRLLAELAGAEQLATVGALVADRPAGRVLRRGGAAGVRYRLGRSEAGRLLRAVRHMAALLFAAGAREVLTGLPGAAASADLTTLDAALPAVDPRRLRLAGFHPTGTAAAGADPQRHPVDPTGAVRELGGLWVADASLVPSSPHVNPQVSIMALALSVGAEVARR